MLVGLGPSDVVLNGDPAPLTQQRGRAPQFSAHVYCGQTADGVKMPLGVEVGLGPGHILLDVDQLPPLKKGHSPPIFGPCLLCPSGWMDQDGTWHGGRPGPRPHCALWSPQLPPKKEGAHLNFRSMFVVA